MINKANTLPGEQSASSDKPGTEETSKIIPFPDWYRKQQKDLGAAGAVSQEAPPQGFQAFPAKRPNSDKGFGVGKFHLQVLYKNWRDSASEVKILDSGIQKLPSEFCPEAA